MRSSASECASCSAPGGSSPSARRISVGRLLEQPDQRPEDGEEPADRRRDGASAVRSGWPSAIPFGTSSPITTCRYVTISSASEHGEERRHHGVELLREHLLAEGADREARDRDAELHRGDEARRVARDPPHGTRAAVALVLQLEDPRPPRRDEAVLGRDEERVQQDQARAGPAARGGRSSRCAARPARAYWAADRRPRESVARSISAALRRHEHMFYHVAVRVEYREEPCKVALNRVKGMPFDWSLNPYMGCVHRCTFCYVRAFEQRADRPADDRYGTSIRVKVNIAEVLRRELAPAVVARRADRDRRRDRSVPAGRGPLPADARVPRGAPRRAAARSRSSRAAR